MAWGGTKPTAFVKVVETDLKDKRNEIAAEALEMVVKASPVDTGAFRESNRVSIDEPDYGAEDEGTNEKAQSVIDAGLAVIADADEPYQAIFIQNNIEYGEILEGGHSEQAPDGIYRPTYAHLRAKYSKS